MLTRIIECPYENSRTKPVISHTNWLPYFAKRVLQSIFLKALLKQTVVNIYEVKVRFVPFIRITIYFDTSLINIVRLRMTPFDSVDYLFYRISWANNSIVLLN